jgi:hypothetical protein
MQAHLIVIYVLGLCNVSELGEEVIEFDEIKVFIMI